jgi:hypothetical protein
LGWDPGWAQTGGHGSAIPNSAETFLSPFMVSRRVFAVPLQAPPHRSRPKPLSGLAFRVTRWPGLRVRSQADPQLIPPPEIVPLTGVWTRAVLQVWLVRVPVAVPPSPKSHRAVLGAGPPGFVSGRGGDVAGAAEGAGPPVPLPGLASGLVYLAIRLGDPMHFTPVS